MTEQTLHDSGERRTFASGAQRDRGSLKPRPDLISPHAQLREGMIYALGAEKYAVRNWEAGMPISECLASAQRHIEQYKRGDTDEDHLAQARWNLGAILHYEEEIKAGRMDPAIGDMPKYAGQNVPYPKRGEVLDLTCVPFMEQLEACRDRHKDRTRPHGFVRAGDGGIWNARTQQWIPHAGIPDPKPEPIGTVYICGPMRGYPQFNFPAFDAARDRWQAWGYKAISPADLDRDAGFDPRTDSMNLTLKAAIERDLNIIFDLRSDSQDAIVLLPGWEDSKGAAVEIALGKFLGLTFIDAETGAYMEMS